MSLSGMHKVEKESLLDCFRRKMLNKFAVVFSAGNKAVIFVS